MNDDAHDQVSRLEAEIEDLAAAAERCRKLIQAAKVVIIVGGVWLLAMILGAVRPDGFGLIAAISCILGGIVTFGANVSTARQTGTRIATAEARRADLIGGLALRAIPNQQD